MQPVKSYRIWHLQRSGSTLLCKALESTNIAGKPGEFFNLNNSDSFLNHYKVQNYLELRAKIWSLGTTPNGVFGIKHSMHTDNYQAKLKEFAQLQGFASKVTDDEKIWADLFPNCKHLHITRRNKVRQAVSWWKAIQDQVWHLEKGNKRQQKESFYEDKYDFDALSHLFKESSLREAAMQNYFERFNLSPFTIVYEDFIKEYEGTVRRILDYLELGNENVRIGGAFYEKTADEHSEKWVQRFRRDLQKNMQAQIW